MAVENDCGEAVTGAWVSGEFSGDFDEAGSGTTGGNGIAIIQTLASARKPSFDFCVAALESSLLDEPDDNASGVNACP